MNSRLVEIKERLFTEYWEKNQWWGDDLSIFDDVEDAEKLAKEHIKTRKALAVQKVCREMPIEIKGQELIVGIATMSSVGFGHTFPRYETDEEAEAASKVCLNRKSVWGHHPPYYPKVLNSGLQDIINEAVKKENLSSDEDSKNFYKSVAVALESANIISARYAELAEKLAEKEEVVQRRDELLEIARICRKVPMKPAESFHEALQSVWFIHMILHSSLNYTSIGRVDQYLWPFYKNDLEKKIITEEYAIELLGSFLVKFNERVQLDNDHIEDHFTFGDWSQGGDPNLETTHLKMGNSDAYTYGQSSNHWLQNCILSGVGVDGKDATNDLSHLIIDLVSDLELIDPLLSVRLHKDSPDSIIETSARALARGGAQPAIFNDDVIIDGMVKHHGVELEDAREYSNDGCWETLPYGRTEFTYGHIEFLLTLESVLNRGKSLLNGSPIGPDSGPMSKYKTFEDLMVALKAQLKKRIDEAIQNKLDYYDEVHKIAPVPFLSGIMNGCMEKGRDLTERGAKYLFYAPLVTGLSHTADSLASIKKLVFEENKLSLDELVGILGNNWNGNEELRLYSLNRVPKYGNDDDYVDDIVVELLGFFCDQFDEYNRKIDWITFAPGIGTFENYPRFGYICGASADGRFSQQAIASNYSPSTGMDKKGPTAVIKSATKFDLTRVNDGCPIDLRIDFSEYEEGKGNRTLKEFIRGFIASGGNLLTISRVNTETLRSAMKHPKKYQGLRVRLGGLTAYFVQLAETQQLEYIKRTEQTF